MGRASARHAWAGREGEADTVVEGLAGAGFLLSRGEEQALVAGKAEELSLTVENSGPKKKLAFSTILKTKVAAKVRDTKI